VVSGRIDIGAFEFGASAADLTGNGFVDFQDLTILLANWNRPVTAAEGNLVNAGGTSVDFADLTELLAVWTGPGGAAAPGGPRLAVTQEAAVSEGVELKRDVRREAPRQAAAYERRAAMRSRPAGGTYGRLQAVDRVMAEEVTRERIVARRRR
jgi:hypothetical protein